MADTYKINGIAVTKYNPSQNSDKAPIIMVHGGNHAAWCWENWATLFSDAGYEVHVLDWYNHGDSENLPEEEFVKRSIADVARKEIAYVAGQLDRPPILMGHSMGGLASAAYAAEGNPLTRLVLVAPVMPVAAHAEPVPLPVDLTKPYPPFPYVQAKQLFFTKSSDEDARRYYEKLVPESPQAVYEAVNWSVDVDLSKISTPTFIVADELDGLIPAEALKRYGELLHAQYKQINGVGHCDLLLKAPEWREAATAVKEWLDKA